MHFGAASPRWWKLVDGSYEKTLWGKCFVASDSGLPSPRYSFDVRLYIHSFVFICGMESGGTGTDAAVTSLDDLPEELLALISSSLDPPSLFAFSLATKHALKSLQPLYNYYMEGYSFGKMCAELKYGALLRWAVEEGCPMSVEVRRSSPQLLTRLLDSLLTVSVLPRQRIYWQHGAMRKSGSGPRRSPRSTFLPWVMSPFACSLPPSSMVAISDFASRVTCSILELSMSLWASLLGLAAKEDMPSSPSNCSTRSAVRMLEPSE